ncbi:MAG TPA: pitrilysin family protein [Vicinamibacterales bacterium]|nr:pitrilysin family protein [Vicinamibacterales bacterium]
MRLRPTPATSRLPAVLALAALAAAAAGAAPRPPRLNARQVTFENGLQVVVLEDHSTPIVHAQLWYHVGSKDERPGRTGFAHLFEHMMFKGSKNVRPELHASLISSVGGESNAYTTEDVTVFWATLPAQYLPLVLWLEADRMASLKVDEATFRREREVVKEERRMRVENQPYGRLSELIYAHAFTVHPYRHTTVGSMKDLEAASVDDVREFYRTYYVPNNATLALVGDFDADEAIALARRYLGQVPRSPRPVPRERPVEPPQTTLRRVTLHENWPLPVIVVAHHIPPDRHADSFPLRLAAKVLSDGQSSRIYRSLVYEKGHALSAFGTANIAEDPNLFFAVAVVQPGRDLDEAERALVAELERLADEAISERELARARNQLARDHVVGRASNQEKATHLAHAVVIHGDAASADREFDSLMEATAADVQRAARAYFTPANRLILRVLPPS